MFAALEEPSARAVKASAINPEAGDHRVPKDKDLAELAAKVGRECHFAFGYLPRRYGNRGEAYARSDGVWMVTLLEMPEELAQSRVDWLAKLLSARGIPSICLEYQLEQLHHALSDTGAFGDGQLKRLLALSRQVGATRRKTVSAERWAAIASTPVAALDPLGAATLMSAVIDQKSGLAKCADSIIQWIENTPAIEAPERDALLSILGTGQPPLKTPG